MEVASLENFIGHHFTDRRLIERALTHRSWAHEEMPARSDEELRSRDNETFEFLGDSVLGMAIAEELFRRNPEMNEGHLTLMKHRLVSMETLAAVAEAIDLGIHIRIGKGEERTGGRTKKALLANTLEAVIAAIFLDAGYETAKEAIYRMFDEHLREATPKGSLDYKTLLQETLQGSGFRAPAYAMIDSDGPPHERVFFVEVRWEGGTARGEGRSIKSAEMHAASEALKQLAELQAAE
jgi:ribonuclease III